MVFWLVISLVAGTSMHVGNFPSLQTCQTAAKAVWQYQSNDAPSGGYAAACVQANTGKQGDPPPPQ